MKLGVSLVTARVIRPSIVSAAVNCPPLMDVVCLHIGPDIEEAFIETIIGPLEKQNYFYPHNFICLPCEPDCSDCDDNSPCLVKFNYTFRIIVLLIQLLCIIVSVVIALVVFKLRYTKVSTLLNTYCRHLPMCFPAADRLIPLGNARDHSLRFDSPLHHGKRA